MVSFCNAAMATQKSADTAKNKKKEYKDPIDLDAPKAKPALSKPDTEFNYFDKTSVNNERATKINRQINQLADLVKDYTKGEYVEFGYYKISTYGETITILENINGMIINRYIITPGENPVIDCSTSNNERFTYKGRKNPKPIFIGNKGLINNENLCNLQAKVLQLSKIICKKINPDDKTCML